MNAEQMKMLEQVKSLLSHSLPDGSWSEVITYLADKHLQKVLGKDHQFKKQTTGQTHFYTKTEARSEAQSEAQTKAQSQPQAQAQSQIYTGIQTQSKTQSKTQNEVQTQANTWSRIQKKNQIKNKTKSSVSATELPSVKIDSKLTMVDSVPSDLTLHQLTLSPSFMNKRKRAGIRINLRRKLLKKANYCCEYVDPKTNTQCQSHYQLQIDHRVPIAYGGTDMESNLRVFCRSHNLFAAKQLGLGR